MTLEINIPNANMSRSYPPILLAGLWISGATRRQATDSERIWLEETNRACMSRGRQKLLRDGLPEISVHTKG
jgi:hypothetical protein